MKTTLRQFLQVNRKIVTECGGFEIYNKSAARLTESFQPYFSYYFAAGDNRITDEGVGILNQADKFLFCDEDSEPLYEINLDDEFEIEGGDGDWYLSNQHWDIYV